MVHNFCFSDVIEYIKFNNKCPNKTTNFILLIFVSCREQKFVGRVLDSIIHMMNDSYVSASLFHCFCFGLEFIILNFSVSVQEKASILRLASNW